MTFEHINKGTCSSKIILEIDDNDIITKLDIVNGCPGNTTGVEKLSVGRNAKEVMELLKGIPCGSRGTSCPNEVAKAIEEYYSK
jgi:uncharacterized protein (TIGR03905 family)